MYLRVYYYFIKLKKNISAAIRNEKKAYFNKLWTEFKSLNIKSKNTSKLPTSFRHPDEISIYFIDTIKAAKNFQKS